MAQDPKARRIAYLRRQCQRLWDATVMDPEGGYRTPADAAMEARRQEYARELATLEGRR